MLTTKKSLQPIIKSPIFTLIWNPNQLQKFFEKKSNWQQQVYLGFQRGWLFVLIIIYLLTLLLITTYNYPVYYPDFFWSGISLDWTMDRVTNLGILFSYSIWPLIGYLTIAATMQLLTNLLSSSHLFFKTNPFFFWSVAGAGALTTSLFPGKIILFIVLFLWITFFGFYKSGTEYKFKEQPFDNDSVFLFFFLFPSIFWLVYGIATLIVDYNELIISEITFENWFGRGVILFFFMLFAGAFSISLAKENYSTTSKRVSSFCIMILFLVPFFWIFYDVTNFSFISLFKGILFFSGIILLWLFINNRLWSWLIISGQLAFSHHSIKKLLLKDSLLLFVPFCFNYRLRKAAMQEPLDLLALGSYLAQNKGWKKLNSRILDLIALEYKDSKILEKIDFARKKSISTTS